MNPLKDQNVSDKGHVHSETAENQSTLSLTDNNEEQFNTNVDVEEVSEILKMNKLNHDCFGQVSMHLPVLDILETKKDYQMWQEAVVYCRTGKINFNDLKIPLDKKEETWKEILNIHGQYLIDITINHEYPWICDLIKNNCKNIVYFDIYLDDSKVSYVDFLQLIVLMQKLKTLKVQKSTNNPPYFFTQLLKLLPNSMEEIYFKSSCNMSFSMKRTPKGYLFYSMPLPLISVVPDKFKSLRCLTLRGFSLGQSILELISLNADTLVHLDLSKCDSPPRVSVFSKLINLQYLNLLGVKDLNLDVITTIAHNCPKLKHLELQILSNECTQLIPNSDFNELKYLTDLEYLHIIKTDQGWYDEESFLTEIANNCKKLKHLDTQFCYLRSIDVKEIIKFKNLQHLNLDSTIMISESLIEIANNCLELRQLITSLKDVDANAIEKLTNLKNLEILNFSDNYYDLTGELLIKIASSCKYLKDIRIDNCNNVTEESLIEIAKLEFLEKLNIDNTVNVPIGMFDYFHNLKELSCRNCQSVTDEGIIKVIDNCQNLSKLYLMGTSVTVETLIHASKRQFVFQILYISIHNHYHERETLKSPYLQLTYD